MMEARFALSIGPHLPQVLSWMPYVHSAPDCLEHLGLFFVVLLARSSHHLRSLLWLRAVDACALLQLGVAINFEVDAAAIDVVDNVVGDSWDVMHLLVVELWVLVQAWD